MQAGRQAIHPTFYNKFYSKNIAVKLILNLRNALTSLSNFQCIFLLNTITNTRNFIARQLTRQGAWIAAGRPGFDTGRRRQNEDFFFTPSLFRLALGSIQSPMKQYRDVSWYQDGLAQASHSTFFQYRDCEYVDPCIHIGLHSLDLYINILKGRRR